VIAGEIGVNALVELAVAGIADVEGLVPPLFSGSFCLMMSAE